ncbi:hypothetical protein Tco_1383282 [Tanacetum coccineum]
MHRNDLPRILKAPAKMLKMVDANKMYYDLRDLYWWSGMKKDIASGQVLTILLHVAKDYKMEKLARFVSTKL